MLVGAGRVSGRLSQRAPPVDAAFVNKYPYGSLVAAPAILCGRAARRKMIAKQNHASISRREFLKLSGLGLGALSFRATEGRTWRPAGYLAEFPPGAYLGRVADQVEMRSAPHTAAAPVATLYADTIVEWLQEVVGTAEGGRINQRWVETANGFIYAPAVQAVRNFPNAPIDAMPAGLPGFWAEVTVPYADLILEGAPISPWIKSLLQYNFPPRLYYGQVVWVDRVKTDANGTIFYRWNEDFGHGYGYGDIYWAEGAALHILTSEDVAPINPDLDAASKRIVVDLTYQTLSCLENEQEVFFCRISSGAKWDAYGNQVDNWATPVGDLNTHWKIISLNMSAGTTGAGYSTPAVPWCTFVHGDGVAIHGAFWHNDFGAPRSHGCINCRPEDAKWIFRWTTPVIPLELNEQRMTWPDHGTVVTVTERTA